MAERPAADIAQDGRRRTGPDVPTPRACRPAASLQIVPSALRAELAPAAPRREQPYFMPA